MRSLEPASAAPPRTYLLRITSPRTRGRRWALSLQPRPNPRGGMSMQTFGSMERRTESQKGTVTGRGRVVRLALGIAVAATVESALAADGDTIRFQLFPNRPVVHCLAASDAVTPTVDVVVRRGRLNDKMKLYLKNFKPGLNFDLFTVQRSPQLADGAADP